MYRVRVWLAISTNGGARRIRGLDGGLRDLWTLHTKGSIHSDEKTAYVQWRDQPQRDHAYLVEKMPPEQVARMIEALMLHVPSHSNDR